MPKTPPKPLDAHRPKIVPHPSARDVRKLKALVLRAKAGLRRDGCVTAPQFDALVASGAYTPAKVVR